MTLLSDSPLVNLGERLRLARSAAGKTQDEVAASIGISRPTLVAIERGQRKVRNDELDMLARLYGVSVNRLLARDAVHIDLHARFRKLNSDDQDARQAISLLNQLASASVELERLLGVQFAPSYPPEQPLSSGSVDRQAEDAALSLRHRLGLGLAPISDIVSLLEHELEIRVFVRRLPSKISGLYAFDPMVGACILLNENHSWKRRALTAAHETGHFIFKRSSVDVVEANQRVPIPEERFATAFALSLLMPASALRKRFADIVASDKVFTPRHLILLAHTFNVSPEAMCRQLERLELLPSGTFDSLRERGFDAEFVRGVLGDPAPEPKQTIVTSRLARLAASAYRRGLLSEGQLARMLVLDRIEIRDMLDRLGGNELDEAQIPLT